MGSERKSRKRRSSPSSSSQDEGKSKRHTAVEAKEIKSDKKEESKSHNKHKSRKSSKHHSDREAKSGEKHKRKRRKHDSDTIPDFDELSSDDYFLKNNEFATWLKEERDLFFSDLSSESARDLFLQFVKDWNNGKLESRYYKGIVSGPRTAHKWKIKKK